MFHRVFLRFLVVFSIIISAAALSACKKNAEEAETSSNAFKVGLVLDKGGIDDKSFNASAYQGALRAKKELGIELKEVQISENNMVEPALKNFARKGYNLVIGIGFIQREPLERAAQAYPKTSFVLIDAEMNLPNVAAAMFSEHEGSFLAGAAAALKTKTNVVGFIGGMDIPMIRRFEMGYKQGVATIAKKQNRKINVISNFIGVSPEAWNNPTKAKELALSQIAKQADVIFHAAGASGLGIFDAVEEESKKQNTKIFAIGVDSNQNDVKPGLVLTSMLKRVDNAIFENIRAAQAGHFQPGMRYFGLKDGGVDLAMDENNQEIFTAEMRKEIEGLKQQILSSKISVQDFYKLHNPKSN